MYAHARERRGSSFSPRLALITKILFIKRHPDDGTRVVLSRARARESAFTRAETRVIRPRDGGTGADGGWQG